MTNLVYEKVPINLKNSNSPWPAISLSSLHQRNMSKNRSEELSLFQTDEVKRLVDLLPDDPANQKRASKVDQKVDLKKGQSDDVDRPPEILSLTPASPKRDSTPPAGSTEEKEESPESPSKNDERWKQEIHQIKRKSSHQRLDRGSLHRLRQSAILMGSSHRHGRSKSFSEAISKNASKQDDSPWLKQIKALRQEYSSMQEKSQTVVDGAEGISPETDVNRSVLDDFADGTIEKLKQLTISSPSQHSGPVSSAPGQSKTDGSVPSFVESVELGSVSERGAVSPSIDRGDIESEIKLQEDTTTPTISERRPSDDDSCSYYEEVVEESVASFEADGQDGDNDSATEVEVVIIEVTDDEASGDDDGSSQVSSAFCDEDEEEFDAESFGSGYSLAVASMTCRSDVSMSVYGEDEDKDEMTITEASGHSTLSALDDSEHTEIVIEGELDGTVGLLGPVEADDSGSEEGV